MALVCIFLWLSAQVATGDVPAVTEPLAEEVSLLQLGFEATALRNSVPDEAAFYTRGGGPGVPYECGVDHTKDLFRPVTQVLSEHPGIDGYCYFKFSCFWMDYDSSRDFVKKARQAVLWMREYPDTCNWRGHGAGPRETARFDAGTVTIRRDCSYYRFDDLYYYSLGWLKNQRIDGSLMTNSTAWEELAAEECEKIRQEYHFTPEETTVGKHVYDNPIIGEHADCAFGYANPFCQRVTTREFKLHVYTKCLLGQAAGEMAYSYVRACLLPGNVVGHGPEECGTCPDGNPCP